MRQISQKFLRTAKTLTIRRIEKVVDPGVRHEIEDSLGQDQIEWSQTWPIMEDSIWERIFHDVENPVKA